MPPTLLFQFHKGTIKTFGNSATETRRLNFNSIKVRLKLNVIAAADVFSVFQFHKGTIKTVTPPAGTSTFFQFQFHKGTIKTLRRFHCVVSPVISIP